MVWHTNKKMSLVFNSFCLAFCNRNFDVAIRLKLIVLRMSSKVGFSRGSASLIVGLNWNLMERII